MIRRAVPDDMPQLLEMGRAFNIEAGYAEQIPFDAESFGKTLKALGTAGLLLVADKGQGAIGMAAADVAPAICNHKVLLGKEAFWYIVPEHRKGLGSQILRALEAAVKEYGGHFFDVVAETGKRSEALARLYRAGGFSPAENVHRKAL